MHATLLYMKKLTKGESPIYVVLSPFLSLWKSNTAKTGAGGRGGVGRRGGGGGGWGRRIQPRKVHCCIGRDLIKPSLRFSLRVLCFKRQPFGFYWPVIDTYAWSGKPWFQRKTKKTISKFRLLKCLPKMLCINWCHFLQLISWAYDCKINPFMSSIA